MLKKKMRSDLKSDLQSVLQIPTGEEYLLYYCRKLCLYNFTVYESRFPNEAYCMLWSEVNGKRGNNEIDTALMQWINGLPKNITELSLFSDTCGGQNRNQHISSLLLYLTQTTHIEIIEQKYLEFGDSFIEVDSMHRVIEREKRHVSVSSVMEWMNILKKGRSNRNKSSDNPHPVKQLHFSDILDLKDLSKRTIKNRLKIFAIWKCQSRHNKISLQSHRVLHCTKCTRKRSTKLCE